MEDMRARNIKPSFFANDVLAEIDPLGRLLFIGLWCLADREGRLEYRPKKIKAALFPYEEIDVPHLVSMLDTKKFIMRYNVDEMDLIKVINFEKHQTPHINETPSILPPSPICRNQKKHLPRTNTKQTSTKHDNTHDHADSGFLIPDSLIPNASTNDPFENFWKLYPRKVCKNDAIRSWDKIVKEGLTLDLFTEIIKGLYRARLSRDWTKENGTYIPYPATWLNGKRWTDELSSDLFTTTKLVHSPFSSNRL